MSYGRFKSKTRPRRLMKSPSGKVSTRILSRKKARSYCCGCGSILVAKLNTKGAKSGKRPSRMFGGVLCGNCVRDTIRARVRA